MAEVSNLSDSEKIDVLNKRLKRIQASTDIQTAITIIVFLGIINMSYLVSKVKSVIK